MQRITSGNTQLDAILGGGFPANSINIVMGEPGSGKTILAERLVFANAEADDRPILYLTTLSEPLEKVVRYLQGFDFYDEDRLATGAVVYESIAEELHAGGIGALVTKMRTSIKTLSPKVVVIDSFKAIHDISTSMPEMRRMLYELAGLLTAYDTTVFLLGEYADGDVAVFPEFAVADGMIQLARKRRGTRDDRFLRVLKLRGSSYQEGLHAFRITQNGLDVFPRLTSPDVPLEYDPKIDRVTTGVTGLDAMLGGGLWAGSSVLVAGQTGAGKTTLALQFVLEGLAKGEPALYVNFQENPTQLARSITSLGWTMSDAFDRGLHLLYASPVEMQIDSILTELFATLERGNVKRVVIDSLGDLVGATEDDTNRIFGYLYALTQHFAVRRIASVMTLETRQLAEHALAGQISALSDAIFTLQVERTGDRVRRTLQVTKARGTEHDLDVHTLQITGKGVSVTE